MNFPSIQDDSTMHLGLTVQACSPSPYHPMPILMHTSPITHTNKPVHTKNPDTAKWATTGSSNRTQSFDHPLMLRKYLHSMDKRKIRKKTFETEAGKWHARGQHGPHGRAYLQKAKANPPPLRDKQVYGPIWGQPLPSAGIPDLTPSHLLKNILWASMEAQL